jgi:hypothetical protein
MNRISLIREQPVELMHGLEQLVQFSRLPHFCQDAVDLGAEAFSIQPSTARQFGWNFFLSGDRQEQVIWDDVIIALLSCNFDRPFQSSLGYPPQFNSLVLGLGFSGGRRKLILDTQDGLDAASLLSHQFPDCAFVLHAAKQNEICLDGVMT